jgi:uncharacterized surface protein with fasciclin (FAS1) repeats
MLTSILTYHVVAGKMSAEDLMKAIRDGGGKATLTTIAGGPPTAMQKGKKIVLTDAKGNNAMVSIADVFQSNGVIHIIDTVLMPN